MNKIFVLILNYRRHHDTINCLRCLQKSDLPKNSKIIILDNTADDSSAKIIRVKFPQIKLIKNKKNLGFAKGNNIGIRYALKHQATHILIINPDVCLPKKFFSPLLKNFQTNPQLGLVAPALKHQVKKKTYFGLDGYLDWSIAKPQHYSLTKITKTKPISAEFLTFACVLISAKVFSQTGLIDERYFMYLEDVDFCLTARRQGFDLWLNPNIIATHQTSASFTHPRHKLKISFISHLKFIGKWLSFPQNIFAWAYQTIFYPYLYLLWTYHHWRYSN